MSDSNFSTIELNVNSDGVSTLVLSRPEVHNVFNETMIEEITRALEQLKDDDSIRVLCVSGAGKSFCAGADLNWMQRMSEYSTEENYNDAMQMARMMYSLYSFPKPTLAVVHGAIFGGGVGLVACCDIVISERAAIFSLAEVKLGLIPAVIGPYVVNALGPRIARRYFLTGERFDAVAAHRLNLVHECVDSDRLSETQTILLQELLSCGPNAQRTAKNFIIESLSPQMDGAIQAQSASLIAKIRASDEGKEGIGAFLAKRRPDWINSTSY